LAAELEKEFSIKPDYIKSAGGAFEVRVDGNLIFSKMKEGRFPEHHEIISAVKAAV